MKREKQKTNIPYYMLASIWIIIDQISKFLVRKYMLIGESLQIVPNAFYITSHRNQGAALGIFSGNIWFFYIITTLFITWLTYHFEVNKTHNTLSLWSFSFLLGGSIGNLIDRILFQEVTDFIYISIINFPIFNFADLFLTMGVIFMGLDLIFHYKNERKKINDR